MQLESACRDQVAVSPSVQVTGGEEVQGSVPDNSSNKYYCVSECSSIIDKKYWTKKKNKVTNGSSNGFYSVEKSHLKKEILSRY